MAAAQIRTVICDWLAWLLRMSRPGENVTLQQLLHKTSKRDLEGNLAPSPNVLAKVQDIDNEVPVISYRSPTPPGYEH